MTETEAQSLNRIKPTSSSLMEVESQRENPKKPFYKRKWFLITTAIILLLLIIIIILIFTVFKVKDPTIKINSISLSGVSPRVALPAIRIELNITLNVQVTVDNPNYASFKHGSGDALIFYLGQQVANVEIPPGNIGSRSDTKMEVKLTLEADKFDMSRLIGDVVRGTMAIEMQTKLAGRAKILGFIKKHVETTTKCQIEIDVSELAVSKQDCDSKAKL